MKTMLRTRLIGAAALATLHCTLAYARAAVEPQAAFVHLAGTYRNTCETHRSSSGISRCSSSSSPSPRHHPAASHRRRGHWFTQDGGRRQRRSGVAALDMAAFWARPPLREKLVSQLPRVSDDDVAVVYFSACDLRIHDHDALVAAAGARGVVPVYVFDDQELAADSRLDAAFAYHAVQDLRKSLRGIGSDLVVRSGDAAEEIGKLAEKAGASHVFFHASPVHGLRKSHERVRASLSSGARLNDRRKSGDQGQPQQQLPAPAASSPSTTIDVRSWSASQLTGVDGLDPSQAWNFRDFEKRLQGESEPARSAYPAPKALPPIPSGIEPGPFPSLQEVLSRVGSRDRQVQEALSTASSEEAPFGALNLCVEGFGETRALGMLDDYLSMNDVDFASRSVFGPEEGEPTTTAAGKAETLGLEAVTTRRIVRARGYGGLAPGEALARALGVAIALGCISPRRMYLARQPDYKPSSSPDGSPSGVRGSRGRRPPSKCWARQLAVMESWHSLLAERDITVGNSQGQASVMEQRYLRWHGWLVRYAVGGSQDDPAAPTALLVHGFGASSDQWDRVFEEFSPAAEKPPQRSPSSSSSPASPPAEEGRGSADAGAAGSARGVRLLALDLVGFGHSAKPPLSFSQYSWADCARDVALRAGGGPFFIAGNSIGGYISMGVAADCKDLCQGVVLVNSAGRILTEDEFRAEATTKYAGLSVEEATRVGKLEAYSAPPNTLLTVLGTGLFAFLQGRIAQTCRNVYPVNPGIVDEGLAENILRDSCDPGAVGVIAAGGKLPFSRSANEMLGKFGGPVLVTQGVKDPLNDAEGRATLFQGLGPQVSVVRLDGGHCPHHEIAAEVCEAMSGFVERVEKERPALIQQSA
ncbi:unnamed protein product [Scytosiphon promiscuus]